MGKVRKGWYEREEIPKVTLDWVKAKCRLTERERELIKIIYDRKLVRRDHLEIISESYRNLGDNRTRLLNRSIKKLYQHMIIDKAHEVQEIGKGNTPSMLAIDKGGSIILGVPHKSRITHKVSKVKETSYITRILPLNHRHVNGVNRCEVDTILFCEDTNNSLLKWEVEVNAIFFHNNEKISLITDAFVRLKLKERNCLIFLEYDTGSENARRTTDFPIIYNKLINYRRYYKSSLWQDKYEVFPLLLLVTEDANRIEYFNKKCKELGLRGYGVYYENYSKILGILEEMA